MQMLTMGLLEEQIFSSPFRGSGKKTGKTVCLYIIVGKNVAKKGFPDTTKIEVSLGIDPLADGMKGVKLESELTEVGSGSNVARSEVGIDPKTRSEISLIMGGGRDQFKT